MSKIINGREIANALKTEIKEKVSKLEKKPTIAVIIVGSNQGSLIYVKSKFKACASVGIIDEMYSLRSDATESDILKVIHELNDNVNINAIMCEFPLPPHINKENIISAIHPSKDVDCVNPINLGLLFSSTPNIIPCTPLAVIRLIKETGIEIEGSNAVIVGRSNIVGKPLYSLLLKENATVTQAHRKTKNLKEICKHADILCVSIGDIEFIKGDFIKEDSVVIDIGINRNENGNIVGDVCFDEAQHAGYITPVPGGVGPLTTAYLLSNIIKLYEEQNN